MPSRNEKLTPEQLEVMRAKVIADPNTRKLADMLKLPFEQYVEQVMKYLANPQLEPQLTVVADEALRATGYEPPSLQKIAAYVNSHAEAQELSGKTKFADPKSQRERVTGKIPAPPPAVAKPEDVREDLKDEVDRERSSGKFNKF